MINAAKVLTFSVSLSARNNYFMIINKISNKIIFRIKLFSVSS